MERFYSHGKLLLSGEYLILRGARGLALPTSRGQSLSIDLHEGVSLKWVSLDHTGKKWFEAEFSENAVISFSDDQVAKRLLELIRAAIAIDPACMERLKGRSVESRLEFPTDWGLGSSSTLVHAFSEWMDIDPFDLLERTFGGSGYDVAVAMEAGPIIYERHEGEPYHETIDWNPPFTDRLWFVHLNKKEDTAQAVDSFLADEEKGYAEIPQINALTERLVSCTALSDFEAVMRRHNGIMSHVLGRASSQERFSDYSGGVTKYLGAWGGDFMLATGQEKDLSYFNEQGFDTIIPFSEMILNDVR